jgi:hypothetical protein
MKITCRFTGATLLQDALFPKIKALSLASEHPLFQAKMKVLLSQEIIKPWYDGSYSLQEKQILFLAIGHNAGLIQFEPNVIAAPSATVLEACFFPMLRIVSWLQDCQMRQVHPSIPKYRISLSNTELGNFKHYLQGVEEARRTRIVDGAHEGKLVKWEHSINKIIKEQNAGVIGADRALNIMVAKWAIELIANELPEAKQDAWYKILIMTDKQLVGCNSSHVQELHDVIEDVMAPLGSVASTAVLKRIREIKEAALNPFGLIDTSFSIVPSAVNAAIPTHDSRGKQYSPLVMSLLAKAKEKQQQLAASAGLVINPNQNPLTDGEDLL